MPKRRTTKKPLFYFEELNSWDKIIIWFYGIASIVFVIYNYWGADEHKADFLIFYTIFPQIFSYFFNYVSLRNLKSFFIWFGFGTLHIVFYFLVKDNAIYDTGRALLLNTVILLLIYQVLRIISLKVQHQELVLPARGGKDIFDNRSATLVDFVLLMIYLGSLWGLTVLDVHYR